MLSSIIIIFFVSLCPGKEIPKDRHIEIAPITDDFPWSSFIKKTGLDPLEYLGPASDDTSETIACTTARPPITRDMKHVTNIRIRLPVLTGTPAQAP
jgi:hypothetical protein